METTEKTVAMKKVIGVKLTSHGTWALISHQPGAGDDLLLCGQGTEGLASLLEILRTWNLREKVIDALGGRGLLGLTPGDEIYW